MHLIIYTYFYFFNHKHKKCVIFRLSETDISDKQDLCKQNISE